MDNKYYKKMLGAILSSLLFGLFYLFFAGVIIYLQITESEKIPTLFFIFILIFLLIPFLAIIVNLFSRIKEIKGGEEDEASKY